MYTKCEFASFCQPFKASFVNEVSDISHLQDVNSDISCLNLLDGTYCNDKSRRHC